MSLTLSEMRYGLKQIIATQGGTITFRDVTTLGGANPAPNPPVYIGLVLDGNTSAGVSSLDMGVDLSQGGVFTGRLIAGDTFLITGDTTVYTVTAPVISPSGADTLTAVLFTPVLAADAADGAVITLGFVADHVGIPASVTDFSTRLIDGSTIQMGDRRVRILASDISGIIPAIGDQILFPDGTAMNVIHPSAMEINGTTYGWYLQVRA